MKTGEASGEASGNKALVKQIGSYLDKRRLISETQYNHWVIKSYFGPTDPAAFLNSNVSGIGYTACAVTLKNSSAEQPDLSESDGIQVCVDEQSIVWVSAQTAEELAIKLRKTFPKNDWETEGEKEDE